MTDRKRKIEIFSAGCSVCEDIVKQIRSEACCSCDIQVLDMNVPDVQKQAASLGIKSIPAVLIDGKIADCCSNRSVNMEVLRSAGLGQTIS